jgi:hypothetical protein
VNDVDATATLDNERVADARRLVTLQNDLLELLESVPEERLDDVRRYVEQLHNSDAEWAEWERVNGGPEADARIRTQIAESDADSRPSIPHEQVATWLGSWGTDDELPAPML